MLRQTAGTASSTGGKSAAFVPLGGDEHAQLTETQFTAGSPSKNELSTVGSYTVQKSSLIKLLPGFPVRYFVNGYEQFTFTTTASPSSQTLTLSAFPIATTRPSPSMPSNALPDMKVFVVSGGTQAGTYLPVTSWSDGNKSVVVDTSGLTASTAYTVQADYLPEGGVWQLQLAAPVGTDQRTKAILTDGTREAMTRDPVANAGYLAMPSFHGFPEILLPRWWTINLRAQYPIVPTLTDSDIHLPARVQHGKYNDFAALNRTAISRVGM